MAQAHLEGGSILDVTVRDAFSMRLMASLEAVLRLEDEALEDAFGDNLQLMRGMRNLLAHVYADIDPAELLRTASDDLGPYSAGLQRLAERFRGSAS